MIIDADRFFFLAHDFTYTTSALDGLKNTPCSAQVQSNKTRALLAVLILSPHLQCRTGWKNNNAFNGEIIAIL